MEEKKRAKVTWWQLENLAALAGVRIRRNESQIIVSNGQWAESLKTMRETRAYLRGLIRGASRQGASQP